MNPPPSDSIYLPPLGGGLDCAAYLQSVLDFYAGKQSVVLLNGVWNFATQMTGAGIKNKTQLYCNGPGVELISTIAYNPADHAAAPLIGIPIASATTGVLSANVAVGAMTILSSITMAVGTIFRIESAAFVNNQHYYIVRDVSGPGPFTIRLDRPVKVAFDVNDVVRVYTSIPQNINVYGNGARISGTGSRYIEFAAARHCSFSGFVFDPNDGTLGVGGVGASFDIGCYDCHMSDIYIDWSLSATTIAIGLSFESTEKCTGKRLGAGSTTANRLVEGISKYNCIDTDIEDATAWGCSSYGYTWNSNSRGNLHCSLKNAAAYDCDVGFNLSAGDDTCVVENVDAALCTASGVRISGNGRITIRDYRPRGNGTAINVLANAATPYFDSLTSTGNTGSGITIAAGAEIVTNRVDLNGVTTALVQTAGSLITDVTDELAALLQLVPKLFLSSDPRFVTRALTKVSAANDRSNSGINAVQAVAGNQPVYNARNIQYNNRPTFDFTAGSAHNLATATSLAINQPNHWYVVGGQTISNTSGFVDTLGAGQQAIYGAGAAQPNQRLGMYAGAAVTGAAGIVGVPVVLCAEFNGAGSLGWVGQYTTPQFTGNPGAGGVSTIQLGGGALITNYMSGSIAAVLAFEGASTAASRRLVMSLLARVYGLPMAST